MARQILSGDPRLTGPLAGQGYGGPLAGSGWSPDFSEADPSALQLNADPMAVDYLGALRQALPQAAARYRVSQFQPGVPQPGLIHDVGYGYGGPVGGAVADMLQAPRTGPEAAMMFGLPAVGAIKAYHGSPHDFERFDMSKIGTGEGAQVYGHGLYFAENEKVAKGYRDKLAPAGDLDKVRPDAAAQDKIHDRWKAVQDEITANRKPDGRNINDDVAEQLYNKLDVLHAEAVQDTVTRNPHLLEKGSMYEVGINADPEHFLDWDKPLSEQPKAIRDFGYSLLPKDATGADLVKLIGENTAMAQRAGIKGIRYKDRGSRGAEGGTHNYVVFSDDIIKILRKYGLAGLTGGAATMELLSGGDKAQAAGR